MSSAAASRDALVVGGGAGGGLAALLLARLGHRVSWFAGAAPAFDLHVLLPPAARAMLEGLGLVVQAEPIHGSRVTGARADALAPGGPRWHRLDESALRSLVVQAAEAAGVELRREIGAVEPTSSGWRTADIEAPVLLCGVAPLLPAPPRVLLSSPVRVVELEGVGAALVPAGQHQMHLHAGGWTWALRRSHERVQVAACGAHTEQPWRTHFGAAWRDGWRAEGVDSLDAELGPSVPGESPPGCLPIGRASFAVSPLSSQGVATALGSARRAASVANSILRRPADEPALRAWYLRQQQRQAERVHRGVRTAGRTVQTALPGEFWSARADLETGQPTEVVAEADRAEALARLHAAGAWFSTPFQPVEAVPVRALQPHGAVIRWADAFQPPGAEPIPRERWEAWAPLTRALHGGRSLTEAFGDALTPALGRSFAAAATAGLLRPVGGWASLEPHSGAPPR